MAAQDASIIDQALELFDEATTVFAKFGIDISPFASQIIITAILLVLLFLFRKTLWPLTLASIVGIVPLIVVAGIAISWIYQLVLPLPDHVFGRVADGNLSDLSVELVDFHDRVLPPGSVRVDTVSGDFAIRYTPSFGDRPRAVVIHRPGCAPYRQTISRPQVAERAVIDIRFSCTEETS
ncbi:hypothetical protein NBZ79_05465 [Sneathiella marina]|uniref:Acriflavin resistance protein n=1 Tax=Sneathiella marina TaxID=2950108 RepID=A0ABY4W673_9PROT|nr:hypothetical protein [Sneathiella marina]USG62424.1 hypothetical protein NBZ79_05465 [Sneathiella marina]